VPKVDNPQRKPVPRQQVRKRHVKKHSLNPMMLVLWSIATAALIVACGIMITTQTRVNSYVDQVSELEAQIADIRAENNLNLARINEGIDYDAIQQQAEGLGMIKLTPDRIIDVKFFGNEYIRQYKSVP